MIFRDEEIDTGDVITFHSDVVGLPEIHGAVIAISVGEIEVFSTDLATFSHNGKFMEEDVDFIAAIYQAKDIIPVESRRKEFKKGTTVSFEVKGSQYKGEIIAALNGVVAVVGHDGKLTVAVSSFFNVIS